MYRVRRFTKLLNQHVTLRYLLCAVCLTFTVITQAHQPPANPAKILYHKQSQTLLRQIAEAADARIEHDTPVVPRLVHFTWGAKPYLRFHSLLSMLSAYHIIRPDRIIIWYSVTKPAGKWWDYFMRNVTNSKASGATTGVIELRYKEDPTNIFGRRVRVAEHKSDILRLEVLRNMGGVYLDTDILVLKSFDKLLYHDVTMGLEDKGGLCNGVIISRPNSTFLNIWWEEYHTFDDRKWAYHSVTLPAQLAEMYPQLCNVLPNQLHRPNWRQAERELIYGPKPYDWRAKNYAMHLWFRFYNIEHDLESVRKLNCTYGQMARYILYGHPQLMSS